MEPTPSSTGPQTSSEHATVRDIMTRDVVAANPETSIAAVAQLMGQRGLSGLPILDADRRAVGIITDHDLIIRNTEITPQPFLPLLEGRIPLESAEHFKRRVLRIVGTEAKDVMTAEVKTIGPDASIDKLAERMIKERMKILPVVEDLKVIGVVTRADVIRWMTSR
jgi:CBS-domain-containing membrane protein